MLGVMLRNNHDMKLNVNQRKILASCKTIIISRSDIIICVLLWLLDFPKRITLVLLDHVFVVLIRDPF